MRKLDFNLWWPSHSLMVLTIPVLRPADRLTLRYDSKTFRLGAGLSLVTLAAITGIFILAARRKKK